MCIFFCGTSSTNIKKLCVNFLSLLGLQWYSVSLTPTPSAACTIASGGRARVAWTSWPFSPGREYSGKLPGRISDSNVYLLKACDYNGDLWNIFFSLLLLLYFPNKICLEPIFIFACAIDYSGFHELFVNCFKIDVFVFVRCLTSLKLSWRGINPSQCKIVTPAPGTQCNLSSLSPVSVFSCNQPLLLHPQFLDCSSVHSWYLLHCANCDC